MSMSRGDRLRYDGVGWRGARPGSLMTTRQTTTATTTAAAPAEGESRPGSADLHIHTSASDGVMSPRRLLRWAARRTDLDVIAVCDHDEVSGGLEAARIAAGEGLPRPAVIVGTEVTTREGHLIGLFVERRIPMLRSLEDTIRLIREQGGLVVAPHPLSWLTPSVSEARLRALLASDDPALRPDAVETLNPSLAGRVRRELLLRLNRDEFGLAETGGSDAHFRAQIGSARTLFPGRTPADVRAALLARTTEAVPGRSTGRIGPHELAEQQWRSMIWHPSLKLRRALSGGERVGR